MTGLLPWIMLAWAYTPASMAKICSCSKPPWLQTLDCSGTPFGWRLPLDYCFSLISGSSEMSNRDLAWSVFYCCAISLTRI
jgi:hypothetical protein